MNKLLLTSFIAALPFGMAQAAIFNGNGNSGFGGAVGGATLELTDDGTTLTGVVTRGGGNFDASLVIFIDSEVGGFADTSTLLDIQDTGRTDVSFGNVNTLTFDTGFEADYAISFRPTSFNGAFDLVAGGNGSHGFVTGVGGEGANTATDYTFSISLANLGLSAGDSFDFVGIYWDPTFNSGEGFISDEAIGLTITPGNVGNANFTANGSLTYTTVPEPNTFAMLAGISALAFVALRRRA